MIALALVGATVLAGCSDPFRIHVADSALEQAPMDWQTTKFDQEGETFGLKAAETRYVHRTDDDSRPPFPGVLQVFSLRGGNSQDLDALQERAQEVLSEAMGKEGIAVDASKDAGGERKLASGVKTRWSMHEGTIQSGRGDFFDPESKITVRVLSEVGVDGKSSTGFIAIAFVKIAEETASSIPGLPPSVRSDERTWHEVAADPSGSIGGATLPEGRGLMFHLVTHA